ncbi:MAG: nitroreductase [Pseudomonadota bacterium]
MDVREALYKRKSIRAFLPKPVPDETIERLLETAQRAPSGGNVQPWHVHVVTGEAKDALCQKAFDILMKNPAGEVGDYPIYPPKMEEPYRTRRFEIGEQLYETLGIAREDKARRQQQMAKNFAFFGAPAALFMVIDRKMGHGQWAHMGMYMQSFALAATEEGLGTCMQEAWAMVRESMREALGIPSSHMVYCAIALGYPDWDKPVNAMTSPRAPLDEVVTWHPARQERE